MEAHERLKVWGKVTEVGTRIYRVTGSAVQRRYPELVEDWRAALVAARVAIAMGVAARDDAVFAERIEAARSALRRSEAYMRLAHELGVVPPRDYAVIEARLSEVQAMLVGLRRRVLGRRRSVTRPQAPP
ncbi:MAG TPA: four helix bundle protein [Gemmatimonadaceae bacterium]|nr:four helix bundle protein [Gemmatimonadaceae bacterium]